MLKLELELELKIRGSTKLPAEVGGMRLPWVGTEKGPLRGTYDAGFPPPHKMPRLSREPLASTSCIYFWVRITFQQTVTFILCKIITKQTRSRYILSFTKRKNKIKKKPRTRKQV